MALLEPQLYRETLAAAEAFHRRKLWRQYSNEDCFGVAVPGEEDPMLAIVMGQAGEEFGLSLFRGANACGELLDMFERDARDDDILDAPSFISFAMGRYDETPPFGRSFLAKARFVGRGSSLVPCFMAKEAGKQPRALTREELEKFLYVLRGALKAQDSGILKLTPIRPGGAMHTLVLSGDPLNPEVASQAGVFPVAPLAADAAPPQLPEDLAKMPRLAGRWLVGFPLLPVDIADDDRTVRMALIVEEETELILLGQAIQGSLAEAVEAVHDAFRGRNALQRKGIPGEILVANRELFNALWAGLDSLGVQCRYEPGLPLLDEVLQGFIGTLEDHGPELEEEEEEFSVDTEVVPSDGDLAGWKACDCQLWRRTGARLKREGGASDRAVARYFGDLDVGDDFLDDPEDPSARTSFFEWCWLDYRATKKSKTLAEMMLAGDLPRAERLLLQARIQATPSIFRVESIRGGESVTLVDILFGGAVEVHDRALSESAEVDASLPARVFPAGKFHFGSMLGPPLLAFDTHAAIEFLERLGLKLTREGTRARPHLFGRLWDWAEERRAEGFHPLIKNTDGDELYFHTATYAANDPASARAAIAAREDVDPDDDGETFTWVRRREGEGEGECLLGSCVTLGTLRFVGDEMLLEVNSAERLTKAREWLDAIPGIAFRSVSARTVDEIREAGIAPDDEVEREEVPMTPELVEHIRGLMHSHYIRWLDTPVPAFGGKTPREMCATPEGKERVARFIRAMPRPVGPADVDVPRKEMFEGLGLSGEEASGA